MKVKVLLCLTMLAIFAVPALADSYSVQVGYADGLRGGGFFPLPWDGDAGVIFNGFSEGSAYDAGAIMITNTSGVSITVNDILVDIGGFTFDLWGSQVLAPGEMWIVTQTHDYNFDTSDILAGPCGVNNGIIPTVKVTVDGSPTTFSDSGQVLNTSGYDFACVGNESFRWRPIGTVGGPAGTPEPASLVLFGTGLLGIGSRAWKRFIG